jgi:hypothetical protein
MLAKVREEVFSCPRYALLPHVRIEVGADVPELRTADAVVVDTQAGDELRLIAIEVKRSRADLVHELRFPEKAAPHDRVCGERYIVLPALVGDYLRRGEELPAGVGLIEVGSRAVVLLEAKPHRVEQPSMGFLKALFRVAAGAAERLERDDVVPRAPLHPVAWRLPGGAAVLSCLHVVERAPLRKPNADPRVACFDCLDERPPARAAVALAIAESSPEDLAAYLRAIDDRARREAPPAATGS